MAKLPERIISDLVQNLLHKEFIYWIVDTVNLTQPFYPYHDIDKRLHHIVQLGSWTQSVSSYGPATWSMTVQLAAVWHSQTGQLSISRIC